MATQVQVQAGKSRQWVRVGSGSVGYMARHGQGPSTGTKGEGRGLKAASEQGGRDSHPPSYSSFSHNSFLNSLSPDYAAAPCLRRLENRQLNPLEPGHEAALSILVNVCDFFLPQFLLLFSYRLGFSAEMVKSPDEQGHV